MRWDRCWLVALFSCSQAVTPQVPASTPPRQSLKEAAPKLTAEQALSAGTDALEATRYVDAAKYFKQAFASPDLSERADIGLGRVQLATGEYSAISRFTDSAKLSPALRCARAELRCEALRAVGQLDAALGVSALEAELPECEALSIARGEILIELGRRAEAEPSLMRLIEAYNDERVADDDAPRLGLVARAAQLLRSVEDANDAFNESERAGRADIRTLLWRAALHLEHNDLTHVAEILEEVLQRAPHDAKALALAARLRVEHALDFDQASKLAHEALRSNPKSTAARAVLAELHLRDMELEQARKELAQGFAVNARDLTLHALSGAAALLSNDTAELERVERRVLMLNPGFAGFYDIVGVYAEWEHRYDDIVALMQRAVKVDPRDARAWAQLGLNHMRNGNRADGIPALETAFRLDPYNVRVHNTLGLEKQVRTQYTTQTVGAFRLLLSKQSAPLLTRYLPKLLERAHERLVGYYKFTPEKPIGIEIFEERSQFAVRTSGLPETAISGVCFGRVLATLSSRQDTFNLPMTLWHELSHVFHIQLSRSRVPRWFTEGLAEYETEVEDKHWSRELDPELFEAFRDKRLPTYNSMNQAFTHAEELEDVSVAYYASTQLVRMIAEQFGRDKLREMLVLWGEGLDSEAVAKKALSLDGPAIDRRFNDYLAKRLARYNSQFVPRQRVGDEQSVIDNARAHKDDPNALVRLGLLGLKRGELDAAGKALKAAVSLAPESPQVLWLAARLALKAGSADDAIAAVAKLLSSKNDGYETRILLARAQAMDGDDAATLDALRAAYSFDPLRREVLEGLQRAAGEAGRDEEARNALVQLVELEEHDAKLGISLAQAWLKAGEPAKAVAAARIALNAGLESAQAHRTLAEALEAAGLAAEARFEQESAELCRAEDDERRAVLEWGAAFWRRQGVPARAKAAAKAAAGLKAVESE